MAPLSTRNFPYPSSRHGSELALRHAPPTARTLARIPAAARGRCCRRTRVAGDTHGLVDPSLRKARCDRDERPALYPTPDRLPVAYASRGGFRLRPDLGLDADYHSQSLATVYRTPCVGHFGVHCLSRVLAMDALSLLKTSAKGTSWAQLADYVSPSFFRVVPFRKSLRQIRRLASSSKDVETAADIRQAVAALGRRAQPPIEVRESVALCGSMAESLDDEQRKQLGQSTLFLYFAQLLHVDAALLDLRRATFGYHDENVVWCPGNLSVTWDPSFIASLRELYRGFYGEDDAQLQQGLLGLGLEPVREPLLAHLGSADASQMRFRTKAFHQSFHEVFEACRDHDITLHENFLPLGLLLACLYESLEALDRTFDVRSAFRTADEVRL